MKISGILSIITLTTIVNCCKCILGSHAKVQRGRFLRTRFFQGETSAITTSSKPTSLPAVTDTSNINYQNTKSKFTDAARFMSSSSSTNTESCQCTPSNNNNNTTEEESRDDNPLYFWTNVILCFVSVGCISVISGLFIGLLTIDPLDLKILLKVSISEEEKSHASTLLPILEKHHLLLVTLLIMNGLAYETLPIFMDKLVPSYLAILLSVTLVLFFGEIVPSAYFTGPEQLQLATKFVPLMKVALWVFYPFAYPLSKLLDHIVNDGTDNSHTNATNEKYSRDELSALIRIQYEERMKSRHFHRGKGKHHPIKTTTSREENAKVEPTESSWRSLKREIMEAVEARANENDDIYDAEDDIIPDAQSVLAPPLVKDEVNLVEGALQLKTKIAYDIYTPLRKVYSLPVNTILDKDSVVSIYAKGYSRIPVYQERQSLGDESIDCSGILGILMLRNLIVVDWDHEKELSTVFLSKAPCISPRTDLIQLTNLFQSGGSHMAFVCARPDLAEDALDDDLSIPVEAGFMGIVTLEDVLEALLQDRVHDEVDIRERDRAASVITRWASERITKIKRSRAVRANKKRGSIANGTGSTHSHKSPPVKERVIISNGSTQSYSKESTLASEKSPLLGKITS